MSFSEIRSRRFHADLVGEKTTASPTRGAPGNTGVQYHPLVDISASGVTPVGSGQKKISRDRAMGPQDRVFISV